MHPNRSQEFLSVPPSQTYISFQALFYSLLDERVQFKHCIQHYVRTRTEYDEAIEINTIEMVAIYQCLSNLPKYLTTWKLQRQWDRATDA